MNHLIRFKNFSLPVSPLSLCLALCFSLSLYIRLSIRPSLLFSLPVSSSFALALFPSSFLFTSPLSIHYRSAILSSMLILLLSPPYHSICLYYYSNIFLALLHHALFLLSRLQLFPFSLSTNLLSIAPPQIVCLSIFCITIFPPSPLLSFLPLVFSLSRTYS